VKATIVKPTSSMCAYDGNPTLQLDGDVCVYYFTIVINNQSLLVD